MNDFEAEVLCRLSIIESNMNYKGVEKLGVNFNRICASLEQMQADIVAVEHNIAVLAEKQKKVMDLVYTLDAKDPKIIAPTRPLINAMARSLALLDAAMSEQTEYVDNQGRCYADHNPLRNVP